MPFSQLDLSFSTHLRKLRFCYFNSGSTDALVFARITSLDVSEIEFAYGSYSSPFERTTSGMPSSKWRALDDILSRFGSLRTVRFRSGPYLSDLVLPVFIDYVKRARRYATRVAFSPSSLPLTVCPNLIL